MRQNAFISMKSAYLSERMSRIDSSGIRKAFDLAAKLKDPINFSIGQPHYSAPVEITEAIAKALKDGATAYTNTSGILPLRERIARKYREVNGFTAHPDNILISSGVASLLQLLFMATIDKGTKVLITDPCFLIYRSMLSFFNADTITIPENFTAEDLASVKADGLKMILYSSPSNPTGYVMDRGRIEQLAQLASKTGALLVSDEIYELFDYEKQFVSAASVYPEAVTLTGFSKSYSMTGLRLAAATGPEALIKAMTTIQQYTVVCAPAPVQWGGITALDLDMSAYVAMYKKNRDLIASALKPYTKFPDPGGAFYIFPETPISGDEFIVKAVNEKNLILVPGSIFSENKNSIRISYAAGEETLQRGIEALTSLYAEFQ
jgi:aminotransferase